VALVGLLADLAPGSMLITVSCRCVPVKSTVRNVSLSSVARSMSPIQPVIACSLERVLHVRRRGSFARREMKHLALAVSDQARSRRFYETYFGFGARPARVVEASWERDRPD
jgi:hypothetical protein